MREHRQYDIGTVRELADRYGNWGRWGPDDERGTLNHVRPQDVVSAAGEIRDGTVISLALPFDENGPQQGLLRRFNPMHLMLRSGSDVVTGTAERDYFGGDSKYFGAADDLVIMPLQSGTQWDALGHVMFEGHLYNGYPATDVSSRGARRNDVRAGSEGLTGRGVLLDLPRVLGVDWLDAGQSIGDEELDACLREQDVEVGRGDHLFVRTGWMRRVRDRGSWDDYCGGPAPGLGIESVDWLAEREVAAVASDTWSTEVRPNQTPDVNQPLHLILIVHLGLWIGEIFDLEELARQCAADGRYSFFFCGPPLPFTGAVGSPLNPIAIR